MEILETKAKSEGIRFSVLDESGKEILKDGIIYDDLRVCPPFCPTEESLLTN